MPCVCVCVSSLWLHHRHVVLDRKNYSLFYPMKQFPSITKSKVLPPCIPVRELWIQVSIPAKHDSRWVPLLTFHQPERSIYPVDTATLIFCWKENLQLTLSGIWVRNKAICQVACQIWPSSKWRKCSHFWVKSRLTGLTQLVFCRWFIKTN